VAFALAGGLGAFAITGSMKELWECTVTFNRFYANSNTFGLGSLWFCLKLLLTDWWILFLLPWGLIFGAASRTWFWLGLWAPWLATGASICSHYYIIVMPFWALMHHPSTGSQSRGGILSTSRTGLRLALGG
jgi:hypothetical protein